MIRCCECEWKNEKHPKGKNREKDGWTMICFTNCCKVKQWHDIVLRQ